MSGGTLQEEVDVVGGFESVSCTTCQNQLSYA